MLESMKRKSAKHSPGMKKTRRLKSGKWNDLTDMRWRKLGGSGRIFWGQFSVGSSLTILREEWFAVLVKERPVLERPGITVIGEVIGAESDGLLKEALDGMVAGGVHLCPEDPCPLAFDGTIGIHATRVRSWALQKFAADYLSRSGKAALKKAIRRCQAPFRWPACCGSSQALKGASQGAFQAKAPSRCWRAGVPSDGEELDGEADATGPDRAALRDKLRETRERIIGSTTPLGARRRCDSWVRGSPPARLVAGTSLSPDQSTPLALAPLAGTRDAGEKNLTIRCRLSFAGSRRAACRQINKPASGARTRRTRERTTE